MEYNENVFCLRCLFIQWYYENQKSKRGIRNLRMKGFEIWVSSHTIRGKNQWFFRHKEKKRYSKWNLLQYQHTIIYLHIYFRKVNTRLLFKNNSPKFLIITKEAEKRVLGLAVDSKEIWITLKNVIRKNKTSS